MRRAGRWRPQPVTGIGRRGGAAQPMAEAEQLAAQSHCTHPPQWCANAAAVTTMAGPPSASGAQTSIATI